MAILCTGRDVVAIGGTAPTCEDGECEGENTTLQGKFDFCVSTYDEAVFGVG